MQKSMLARLAVGAAAALIVSGLLGCSEPTPEENSAQACTSINALREAVLSAKEELSKTSTVAQVEALRSDLQEKYQAATQALENVEQDRVERLDGAWANFEQAIKDLDESQTVVDAAGSLTDEVNAINTAQEDLRSALSCN